jgi:enamine deaminase RidA (YjgF/YER057c/UK114 family)
MIEHLLVCGDGMMVKYLLLVAVALTGSLTASAQELKQIPLPPSQNPSNADLPISAAVWGGNTLYVSGWLDPDMKTHTDTKSQTVGIFEDIKKLLASQNLTMGDVVMIHVFLGNNPATDGKPDFSGLMAGYTQFFGTKDQPSKPARTTVQVTLPAASRGALIEVDLVAVRRT